MVITQDQNGEIALVYCFISGKYGVRPVPLNIRRSIFSLTKYRIATTDVLITHL